MPQSLLFGLNDSVLNGIAISAVQPSSSRVAAPSQIPSQLLSRFVRVLVERFPAHAVRVDLKAVAVAAVEVRIEDHREAVLAGEPFALAQHLRRDPLGFGVPEPRRDVQRIVVVVEANLGALRRRRVLDGIELMQVVDERRVGPRRLVEHAVDRCGAPASRDDRERLGGLGVVDDRLRSWQLATQASAPSKARATRGCGERAARSLDQAPARRR